MHITLYLQHTLKYLSINYGILFYFYIPKEFHPYIKIWPCPFMYMDQLICIYVGLKHHTLLNKL